MYNKVMNKHLYCDQKKKKKPTLNCFQYSLMYRESVKLFY